MALNDEARMHPPAGRKPCHHLRFAIDSVQARDHARVMLRLRPMSSATKMTWSAMRASLPPVIAFVVALTVAGADADFSGRWVADVETPFGPVSYTFSFSVDG